MRWKIPQIFPLIRQPSKQETPFDFYNPLAIIIAVRHPDKSGQDTGLAVMNSNFKKSKPVVFFLASRPKFLTASAAPVLVGSALAFASAHTFSPPLFVLALLAIMFLHAGANITNDYFDHTSKNDWLNKNPTPFSGGRRYIQQGILTPGETLTAALVTLAVGSALGIVIVLLTRSIFILLLGLAGLLGGYFYTAAPVRLGYRSIGELVIAALFGLLPVYGSYYLQTQSLPMYRDVSELLPALLVSVLIFLVILINEFPDAAADAAVNKKTLVVRFGVPAAARIYKVALIGSYAIAIVMTNLPQMFFAGLFYLFTFPLAVFAVKCANPKDLTIPGQYRANQITVLLHTIGTLSVTIGFIISAVH
jgi:1,4-dihydroxy-2-naphthoate octaprenyltransferase